MLISLADGVKLNVEVDGSGQPLLLLHGFTGSAETWRDVAEELAPHFKVIAPDFLGHGRSESPPDPARYRMEQCVDDLSQVLVALDAAPAHVAGYSMGGRVALGLAITRPKHVRSLVLESASPGLASASERGARVASDEDLASRILAGGMEQFVSDWENLPLFASQAQLSARSRSALRAIRLRNNALGLANSLRGLGTGAQPEFWSQLGEVQAPCLILCGDLDTKFCAIGAQMAGQIPRARRRVVQGAGHTVHFEQPAEYVRHVIEFLNIERVLSNAN